MIEMLRKPTRRETIRGVGMAALATLIAWYFGVNVWHSILLGCAATVAWYAVKAGGSIPDVRDLGWRHKNRGREGSRHDVSTLSFALHAGWGVVGATAERRLDQIARRRLALEGLDPGNAEDRQLIESRIGTAAYRALLARNPTRGRMRLRTLVHCLDALDALDRDHYPVARPQSRRWLPNLIRSNPWRTRER
jgi:hypothetical protein